MHSNAVNKYICFITLSKGINMCTYLHVFCCIFLFRREAFLKLNRDPSKKDSTLSKGNVLRWEQDLNARVDIMKRRKDAMRKDEKMNSNMTLTFSPLSV